MLRIRAFPFHQDVADFIAEHEFVFLVEQNRDAQMRSLVVNEYGIDPMKIMPILHYDGTPITARFHRRRDRRQPGRAEGGAQGGVVGRRAVRRDNPPLWAQRRITAAP
jgi:hypothetical protein